MPWSWCRGGSKPELVTKTQRWFGDFSLPSGERLRWRIGPLELLVEHTSGEWRLWEVHGDELGIAEVESVASAPDSAALCMRYAVLAPDGRLTLMPVLPDRPVIARPISPITIPAGEAVRLYVGLPAWLQLAVGPRQKALTEIPVQRLSDTWFGPNTREGELCYALRSRCRRMLEGETDPPYRIMIPLHIHNRSLESLVLERIKVPAPQLGLYAATDGRLWTGEIGLERTEDGRFVLLHLESGPPAEARTAVLISGPREPAPRKTAIRALSALFQ